MLRPLLFVFSFCFLPSSAFSNTRSNYCLATFRAILESHSIHDDQITLAALHRVSRFRRILVDQEVAPKTTDVWSDSLYASQRKKALVASRILGIESDYNLRDRGESRVDVIGNIFVGAEEIQSVLAALGSHARSFNKSTFSHLRKFKELVTAGAVGDVMLLSQIPQYYAASQMPRFLFLFLALNTLTAGDEILAPVYLRDFSTPMAFQRMKAALNESDSRWIYFSRTVPIHEELGKLLSQRLTQDIPHEHLNKQYLFDVKTIQTLVIKLAVATFGKASHLRENWLQTDFLMAADPLTKEPYLAMFIRLHTRRPRAPKAAKAPSYSLPHLTPATVESEN